jgi:hypothetical protein
MFNNKLEKKANLRSKSLIPEIYYQFPVFWARIKNENGETYVGACSFSGKPCFLGGDPPLPTVLMGTKLLPSMLKEVTVCLLQKYCSEQYICLNTACKFNTTTSKTFAQLKDLSTKLTRNSWKELLYEISLRADFFDCYSEEYRINPGLIIDCTNIVSKLSGRD